jgi:hypothetical protein
LQQCEIENTNTGTWEGQATDPTCAARHLRQVLMALAEVTNQADEDSVDLDHIWVYIDKGLNRQVAV